MTLHYRARKYVEKMDPAIAGSGGHNQTYSVAMTLLEGFGLDEAAALEILREYNRRCQPPWTDKELRHKVKSANSRVDRSRIGRLVKYDHPNISNENRQRRKKTSEPSETDRLKPDPRSHLFGNDKPNTELPGLLRKLKTEIQRYEEDEGVKPNAVYLRESDLPGRIALFGMRVVRHNDISEPFVAYLPDGSDAFP